MASLEINAKNFALALGIWWGIVCLIMGFVSETGYGLGFVHGLATIYVGYQPGLVGAILGAIYGFIDGFVFGFITISLYNYFNNKA